MAAYTRQFPWANLAHLYTYEFFESLRRSRVYDTDYALFQDEAFYAKIWRDAEISRCLTYRAQMVAGTKKEWITSREYSFIRTVDPTGSTISGSWSGAPVIETPSST